MRRNTRIRRQHVVLRRKRRDELKHRIRVLLIRSSAAMLIVGFALGLVVQGDSVLVGFVRRHTPQITLAVSPELKEFPIAGVVPASHLWLWIPGTEHTLRRKWMRQYPEVRDVQFERHVLQNRIQVHITPRVPLVRWQGQGLDAEGHLFPVRSETPLPVVLLAGPVSWTQMGHWLSQVAQQPDFWMRVQALTQNGQGDMVLELKTGTQVAWGRPDLEGAQRKARGLEQVLKDAHERLGGAASADIRFFEEGRIVVRPKSVS